MAFVDGKPSAKSLMIAVVLGVAFYTIIIQYTSTRFGDMTQEPTKLSDLIDRIERDTLKLTFEMSKRMGANNSHVFHRLLHTVQFIKINWDRLENIQNPEDLASATVKPKIEPVIDKSNDQAHVKGKKTHDISTKKNVASDTPNSSNKTHHPELRFCPYKWVNAYVSYVPTNCSVAVTNIPDVVTVIFNFMTYANLKVYNETVHGLLSVHPYLKVLVAWPNNIAKPKDVEKNVEIVGFAPSSPSGHVWSKLVSKVKTTYVLVARDVYYMDEDIELERMLRVMVNLPDNAIIGGATRTPNGHWRASCEQMSLRNYTLAFKSGYRESTSDGCLYCDYPIGPFLTKTKSLTSNVKEDLKDDTAVFTDYFIRKRKAGVLLLVCPDSMFHVLDYKNISNTVDYWLATAKNLKLEFVSVNGNRLRLPCDQLGFSCRGAASSTVMPPCCLKRLSDEMAFLMNACEKNNMYCDLRAGNLIGGVKMSSTLPWELDGDFYVLENNHTAFRKLGASIGKNGWSVSGFNPVNFRKKGSPWRIEVYKVRDQGPPGKLKMESTYYTSKGMLPTRVNVDGHWLVSPRNPGRLVMREYEMSVYKHAQHNMLFGKRPLARYSERRFKKCGKPGFHACLDQYESDGNMQFNQDFWEKF